MITSVLDQIGFNELASPVTKYLWICRICGVHPFQFEHSYYEGTRMKTSIRSDREIVEDMALHYLSEHRFEWELIVARHKH